MINLDDVSTVEVNQKIKVVNGKTFSIVQQCKYSPVCNVVVLLTRLIFLRVMLNTTKNHLTKYKNCWMNVMIIDH
jgi:hypothetical protein